ncbi:hypothetical protein OF83DRAFT_1048659 [Amylostereum chailletii]|nr:hypothetical protein OF83DRAFT_1048659 [Amylostereum chailletii]
MAAAVATPKVTISISNPFQMVSSRMGSKPHPSAGPAPSSSRTSATPPRPTAVSPEPPDAQAKTFKRLRSSFEQSVRAATRSKAKSPPPLPVDEFATVTVRKGKEKEKEQYDELTAKELKGEKERSTMLKRLESKVAFRRTRKESTPSTSVPPPPIQTGTKEGDRLARDPVDKIRAAGFTSFQAPSLRQASMSSPSLHLSSQALPSPTSQSAIPASSSSGVSALVSPTRSRFSSSQLNLAGKEISGPSPLTPTRRDSRGGHVIVGSPPPRRRPSALLPSSPSSVSLAHSPPSTPTRGSREPVSPPSTPTPTSRTQVTRRASASTSRLPLNESPAPRASSPSPIRARSPTASRPRVVSPTSTRGLTSSSTSHLPLNNSPPSPTPFRRGSTDSQRPPLSPTHSRAASPSAARPRAQRAVSPSIPQTRHLNTSPTSLSASSNPEHREAIRSAVSILCREMLKPSQMSQSIGRRESEEVEMRLRSLARLERVWGKSGASAMGSSSQLGMNGGGISGAGEDRERRLFSEALRDGYVLCQCVFPACFPSPSQSIHSYCRTLTADSRLMNKLRPGSISRTDPREDGRVRTSNVTKFLASCTSNGLSSEDLFLRDDLIEGTSECLARVACTIIALLRWSETPPVDRSRVLRGGDGKSLVKSSPYGGTISRAASSTPNLAMTHSSPVGKKRWSPPSPGLPTVRSDSPASSEGGTARNGRDTPSGTSEVDDVPPIPPPRSPLRSRPSERHSIADSTRASVGDSVRASMADSMTDQSVVSSVLTDSTAFSLLEVHRTNSNHNRFGTMRTTTTVETSVAPSEWPSISRTEGSSISATMGDDTRKRDHPPRRDRRPSETAPVDLSRVAEESEDFPLRLASRVKQANGDKERERVERINLGKGKWPDDFMDVLQPPTQTPPILVKRPTNSDDEFPTVARRSPLSISPPSPTRSSPRKVAIVGASRTNESLESLPQFPPRRPTHTARHSVDNPVLLPKDSLFRRDSSPEAPGIATSGRVMLRRSSSKANGPRSGVYMPRRNSPDEEDQGSPGSDSPVPFPRTVSAEHGGGSTPTSQDTPSSSETPPRSSFEDRRLLPRGRFQSEVDGSSTRRRPRPNSYDEFGAKPRRSRFESMVNLGVASSNASASDLLPRDAMEGSAVKQTLIVREEGKAPTHFQLGNCIGRGQFGSVYRALNLNTGQMVAVKRIGLEGLKEDEVTQLMREVDLVKSLSHPSIVKYEGMARDDNTLSIVLEYAENGSLGQTLKAFGKLNERLVASYVVKILEGLDYLHQSDVVHCDLKAANILTTKNGNVKLSDFGVSLNLRAMEREIKDVAGTPNWMAPEVIELKGASTKSDIWSLACTVIELLTGRPPYGDIANIMFRIVEDDMPPLPETCSDPLKDFLTRCFNKDPSLRPNAETLFEHEWLKKHWGLNKASDGLALRKYGGVNRGWLQDLRPQDSIPFLRRVSADLHKNDAVRHLAGLETPEERHEDGSPGSPVRQLSNDGTPSSVPEFVPESDPFSMREHTFVKTSFSKPVVCRVCMQHVKKSAVLCSQCSLIAHSRCAGHAPPTCDLRSQLLLYAQFAERGSPVDFLGKGRSGPSSDVGASSSRASLDTGVSPTTSLSPSPLPSPYPPTAYKKVPPLKRSSLTPDPARSNSSTSLATNQSRSPPVEPDGTGNVLRRKLSTMLQRPKERDRDRNRDRDHERPRSLSSVSTNPHSSSMRSRTTTTSGRGANRAEVSISEADDEPDTRPSLVSVYSRSTVTEEERVPGSMPAPDARPRRTRGSKSDGNCVVQ